MEKGHNAKEPLLFEADHYWKQTMGQEIATTLVQPDKHRQASIPTSTNPEVTSTQARSQKQQRKQPRRPGRPQATQENGKFPM